jgi:hypothetical protein
MRRYMVGGLTTPDLLDAHWFVSKRQSSLTRVRSHYGKRYGSSTPRRPRHRSTKADLAPPLPIPDPTEGGPAWAVTNAMLYCCAQGGDVVIESGLILAPPLAL